MHDNYRSVDSGFEARIHDDVRIELLCTPKGPIIEIETNSRDLPDRSRPTDNQRGGSTLTGVGDSTDADNCSDKRHEGTELLC